MIFQFLILGYLPGYEVYQFDGRFQFLILGYFIVCPSCNHDNQIFQFLILGYLCARAHKVSRGTLSIPHFRIQEEEELERKIRSLFFQFLILGYRRVIPATIRAYLGLSIPHFRIPAVEVLDPYSSIYCRLSIPHFRIHRA